MELIAKLSAMIRAFVLPPPTLADPDTVHEIHPSDPETNHPAIIVVPADADDAPFQPSMKIPHTQRPSLPSS